MNDIKIKKFGVIIDEKLFNNEDGDNINGPCLIKVPSFIKNPLGSYYLYFAHHKGKYIRMAYSDNIQGPYKLYEEGVLHLENTPGYDHVASPDVIIGSKNSRLIMYYHCPYDNGITKQSTFYAYSNDGLNFKTENINILHPYFRSFVFNDEEYGICMYKLVSSIIMKKINNNYEEFGLLLPKSRHTSILISQSRIFVFYTIVGDCPEHICFSEITNLEKNNINVSEKISLIIPEFTYEHDNQPELPSKYGLMINKVNQLRDPYIYLENDQIYLLYTVCGEKGIALCRIDNFIS